MRHTMLTNSNADYGYVFQHLDLACQELVGSGTLESRLEKTLTHLCKLDAGPQDPIDNYFPELYSRIQAAGSLSGEQMDELAVDILKYYREVCAQCHKFIAAG